MSGSDQAALGRPLLRVTLGVEPDGLRVVWRLSGVRFRTGERVARLPLSVAGGPTIELPGAALAAWDDAGPLPLAVADQEREDGVAERGWWTQRDSVGGVTVEYLATPNDAEPLAATPPLELRREGGGFSGALKCFVVLPDAAEDLTFELSWDDASLADTAGAWTVVTSLGEVSGDGGDVVGTGLERLGDTYLMCGDLTGRGLREGQLSVWWLTPPGLDVAAFTARLAETYAVMAEAFDAPPHPFRVFFRPHPHRGLNASAHPASFVIGMNPGEPAPESSLFRTLAHELVHEWLHLDGPEGEVRWFVEGAADYYSLVLPLRAGLLDDAGFLQAINVQARTCYANPRRHLTMAEIERLFYSDFFASRLPYGRGAFYLADLDARLRAATSGERSVDDVVVEVTSRRRDGVWIGLREWCAVVEQSVPGDERQVLDALVFTGAGRPAPTSFAPRFEMLETEVPNLDLGFDPLTFATRRVSGLVAGGPAERAGLREGDQVELPTFQEALALTPDDALTVGVVRDGRPDRISLALDGHTISVPQWRTRAPLSGQRQVDVGVEGP